MRKRHRGRSFGPETGQYISFAITLGLITGIAIGALMGNAALGIGMGTAFGVAISGIFFATYTKKLHRK